jgi:hypothetical protein
LHEKLQEKEAIEVLNQGLSQDPENTDLKTFLEEIEEEFKEDN